MLILTIVCLIWATIEDIRFRIIPDKIWVIQIIGGIIGLIIWFQQNDDFRTQVLIYANIIIGIVVGILMLYIGSWGGGDSKAFIAISISSPYLFKLDEFKYNPNILPPILYFAVNLAFYFVIFSFLLIANNLYSIKTFGLLFGETSGNIGAKINVLLSSRRISKEKVENLKHEDPAETFDTEWRLYAPLFQKSLTDEEYEIIEREARQKAWIDVKQTDRTYLWTRPQPPGLLFFLLAYITYILIISPIYPLLS